MSAAAQEVAPEVEAGLAGFDAAAGVAPDPGGDGGGFAEAGAAAATAHAQATRIRTGRRGGILSRRIVLAARRL
jgi:hypothetical protein